MKTLILSLILIFCLAGTNHGKPINEIYSINEIVISEEANINDIPFDTWEIAVEALMGGDEVKLKEEPYVNDIPFDTREIACKYMLCKMMDATGEVNIDDIPFDTERIYCEYMAAQLTEQFRNEKPVHDLPKFPSYIICTYENGVSTCYTVNIKHSKKFNICQKRITNSDFTIIYPVKAEIPMMEMSDNDIEQEIIVTPGFEL